MTKATTATITEQLTPSLSGTLIAQRTGTGYSWTLASRLGQMLAMAEERFGERDLSYTVLGVEFVEDGPRLWYPNFGARHDVVIQLGLECLTDAARACYELAHECVHLLSPTGANDATMLEEGLATWFAGWYMQEAFGQPTWQPATPGYRAAKTQAALLLARDPYAVRRLREEEPVLSKISGALILEHYPDLPDAAADSLAARFVGT